MLKMFVSAYASARGGSIGCIHLSSTASRLEIVCPCILKSNSEYCLVYMDSVSSLLNQLFLYFFLLDELGHYSGISLLVFF